MSLIEHKMYHFYNQGNNRCRIFFKDENYLFFLQKFRKYVMPYTQTLTYCLMPNHFHFLLYITKESLMERNVGSLKLTSLTDGFRQLLSSYTQAINKQENRSGSLFRQKTKAKLLEDRNVDYPFICFHYIHQNPMVAGLVNKMEDWKYSSFSDYMDIRHGTLCNESLAFELLDISKDRFYEQSYAVISPDKVEGLFC